MGNHHCYTGNLNSNAFLKNTERKESLGREGGRRFTHIPYVISQGWFRLFCIYYVPLTTFTAAFINAVRMPHFVFSFAHICRETQGGEPAQSAVPRSRGVSSGYILRERWMWRRLSCTRTAARPAPDSSLRDRCVECGPVGLRTALWIQMCSKWLPRYESK